MEKLPSPTKCFKVGDLGIFQVLIHADIIRLNLSPKYSEIYNERVTNYKREKKKTEQLLTALLPRSIIHQLKRGQVPTPQTFHSVSILLCDIVGFTQLAADSTAHQVSIE